MSRLFPPLLLFILLLSCRKEETTSYVPEGYRGWKQTTNVVLDYPIPGHENHWRRIYINSTGEGVTSETREGRGYDAYPEGTIIVKEIYPGQEPKENDTPVGLAVMIKDTDNYLARGGWVWVDHDVATGKEKVIDYEFCFDCHANANEGHPYGDKNPDNEYRDYVFFPYRGP